MRIFGTNDHSTYKIRLFSPYYRNPFFKSLSTAALTIYFFMKNYIWLRFKKSDGVIDSQDDFLKSSLFCSLNKLNNGSLDQNLPILFYCLGDMFRLLNFGNYINRVLKLMELPIYQIVSQSGFEN